MRNLLVKRRGKMVAARPYGLAYRLKPGVLLSIPYRLRGWHAEGSYKTATERDAVLRSLKRRSRYWDYRAMERTRREGP